MIKWRSAHTVALVALGWVMTVPAINAVTAEGKLQIVITESGPARTP